MVTCATDAKDAAANIVAIAIFFIFFPLNKSH
jgi:hypothetical protein